MSFTAYEARGFYKIADYYIDTYDEAATDPAILASLMEGETNLNFVLQRDQQIALICDIKEQQSRERAAELAKKADNAAATAKKMREEIAKLVEKTGVDVPQAEPIKDGVRHPKLDELFAQIAASVAEIKTLSEISKAYAEAKKECEQNLEQFRAEAFALGIEIDALPYSDGTGKSMSRGKGRSRVVIDDVMKLPQGCYEEVTVRKANLPVIEAAFERGEDVSGSHMEKGPDYPIFRGA